MAAIFRWLRPLKGHVTLQDVLCLRDSPAKILARHAHGLSLLLSFFLSLGQSLFFSLYLFLIACFFVLPSFFKLRKRERQSLAFQDYTPFFVPALKRHDRERRKLFLRHLCDLLSISFLCFSRRNGYKLLGILVFLFTSFVSYIYGKLKKKKMINQSEKSTAKYLKQCIEKNSRLYFFNSLIRKV